MYFFISIVPAVLEDVEVEANKLVDVEVFMDFPGENKIYVLISEMDN